MNRKFHSIYVSLLITGLLLSSSQSYAKTLFEAYYKILSNGIHVGYIVQRYSYDKEKKRFEGSYMIRTNKLAGNAFESLKSYANEKYEPISYEYRFKEGKNIKTIDATFTSGTMNAVINDKGKKSTVQKKLKPGTFLSGFLGYLMLSNGLSVNKKFNYTAIAEEDATELSGSATVLTKEKYKGIPVFRIKNQFKDTEFESLIDEQSQVLYTISNRQKLSTQIVGSAVEATQGQNLSSKSIQALFGGVPLGRTNTYYQSLQKKTADPVTGEK